MTHRILLLSLVVQLISSQYVPQSPCPEVFRYYMTNYQWYGIITASDPPPLGDQMRISMNMSFPARLATNYIGSVEFAYSLQEVVRNIQQRSPIYYRVFFPLQNPLPSVDFIWFANRLICFGPPAAGTYVTTVSLHRTFYPDQSGVSYPQNQIYPQRLPVQNEIPTTTTRPQWAGGHNEDQLSSIFGNQNNGIEQPPLDAFTQKTTMAAPVPTWTTRRTTTQRSTTARTTTQANEALFEFVQCGTLDGTVPLIHNGENTARGDWPWLVGLFWKKLISTGYVRIEFKCGSSLVSEKIVVTAAHCVTRVNGSPIPTNELILKLGAYNIDEETDDLVVKRTVSKIIVRNDFERNGSILKNDLAVMVMGREVSFNRYIRPVCLWSGNDNLDDIIGKYGSVVGWGRDQTGLLSREPKLIVVPIISTETCRASDIQFFKLTSNTTFCAGSKGTSTGPCNGDSGGGLYMFHNGFWTIRGVVSSSLADESNCNTDLYTVYTDVAKFSTWISGIY